MIKLSKAQAAAMGIATNGPGKKRGMNRWEKDYAALLETMRITGQILWWGWETIKLRLAEKTWYTPDFTVVSNEFRVSMIEVKGFMRDDAAVKLKVAAESFPFWFILAKKVAGQWEEKTIPGRATR